MQAMKAAIARIGMISIGFTIGHLVFAVAPPHAFQTAGFPDNGQSRRRLAGDKIQQEAGQPLCALACPAMTDANAAC